MLLHGSSLQSYIEKRKLIPSFHLAHSFWSTLCSLCVFPLDVEYLHELPIQSPLLVRCEMSSPCGCITTLMEIPNNVHCQLSPELGMAHWTGVVFLQLSIYRMHVLDTSIPQKNNFCHHLSVLQRKQYIAVY
jgi:hypothetical protein